MCRARCTPSWMYRQLVALRPKTGSPFVPSDLQLMLRGEDGVHGEPIAWPAEVPLPPADVVRPDPSSACLARYVVAAKYEHTLNAVIERAQHEERPFHFNGAEWRMFVMRR